MAKRKARMAETNEDKKSKRNLHTFLKVNQQALQQVFDLLSERLRSKGRTTASATVQHLNTLRLAAFEGQKGIEKFFERGMNKAQRKLLSEVGLFHDTLLAKLQLLWDCLRDGSLSPILKTLNSLLGSLAKIFAPLHAVKEFKEMMEVAVDRLGPKSDPIVLNLGQLPGLE
jgi:hypothetical protein